MGYFRVMITELNGDILKTKYFHLPADTVEQALLCSDVAKMQKQAKKDGLCFRVTKEE